jgi:hypothetical protein
MNASAEIPTSHASRYLQQLCKHFAHKRPVTFDPRDGAIHFDIGDCKLHAEDETLRLDVESPDTEQLDRLKDVVERHLVRFAFREELSITWH